MVRFRETVFVHNVGTDERFCNHPRVKSVIALPIIRAGDLLGVLYLVSSLHRGVQKNRDETQRNLICWGQYKFYLISLSHHVPLSTEMSKRNEMKPSVVRSDAAGTSLSHFF